MKIHKKLPYYRMKEKKMVKKIVWIILSLMVIGTGTIFAEEIISIEDYRTASTASVDLSNAQELLYRVNALLTKVGAYNVRVSSGARNSGGVQTHRLSNAIDLSWDPALYEKLKENISGSNLRLELIEGIRAKHKIDPTTNFDHIHLDTVDTRGGRTFMP
jgi:hypothetical protein